MAVNTRFATGVHALLLLAVEPDVLQTSEDVARKLNTNPVVIRRVFSLLQQAELVESQKGPSGGSRLARSAKEISLADIYRALSPGDVFHAASVHASAGGKLNQALNQVFKDAQKALEKELAQTSLSQLVKKSVKKEKH
ncbi:Rrf2 family transcriptional regulator [Alloacidobacterium dinghuense]|uniref:Rrf2 family transcriptional regulator n=1 Tax=Alloacidobacterium dinghuense TaxID=2763107 RepID=A0A7G8BMY3_9BACT|nr:Rrf2 family transcriptional regulator [Alloacidobacterium dinghuense]QNI33903.1 Rrf2 family transcriptional regulator [Alloacidobacterium dinghuense]